MRGDAVWEPAPSAGYPTLEVVTIQRRLVCPGCHGRLFTVRLGVDDAITVVCISCGAGALTVDMWEES